jgi:hypothetical protein
MLQINNMKKVLIPAVFFLLLLFVGARAQPQQLLDDQFTRSLIAPWEKTILSPCSPPTTDVNISGTPYQFLMHTYQTNCLSFASYRFGSFVNDFSWQTYFWVSWSEHDILIMEWWDGEGNLMSVRFNRDKGVLEFDHTYGSITNFLTRTYPDWATTYSVPFDFGSAGQSFDFNITKVGNNIKVYRTDGGVTLIADWTSPYANVRARSIALARYNPSTSNNGVLDETTFYSLTTVKAIPSINLTVSPARNVTYGTEQMISCTINPPTIPITLYYFTTPVTNPYRATLPVGNHYFRCESNETADYYSYYASQVVEVYGAITPTTTVPSPIPNVSQPVPQLVNETEWRQAGYGWALFFVSPIGLITFVTLFVSAGMAKLVGQPSGVYFGIIAFIFLWLLLVMFTGILPTWIFLVIVVIAGFIVAQVAKKII